jgi:hypothetical protein
MSMMMSASKKKKKKATAPTHKVSSKIQKEVQNILVPGFDEVYKSKVMSDEDKKSLLYTKYHGNLLDLDYGSLPRPFWLRGGTE